VKSLLSAVIFLFSTLGFAEPVCVLPNRPPEAAAVEAWKKFAFSDPKYHSSKTFAYLVSAMSMTKADLRRVGGHIELERSVIYASLINQKNRFTFGTVGIILGPPTASQLVEALPYDTASMPCERFDCRQAPREEIIAKLKSFQTENGIYTPEQILTPIKPSWNEVVLTTLAKNERFQVKGVFLIIDGKNKPLSWSNTEEEKLATETAAKFGLPLIRIPRLDPRPGMQFPPNLEALNDCTVIPTQHLNQSSAEIEAGR
jgi:hypothetical protein